MRAKKLTVKNLMGIDELEIDLGKVTILQGANASGKSSVLEAVKAIIGGGHDATLLRTGAEEGEGVLVLDDDVELRKRVTETRSTLTVSHPRMGKVSAGQTFVDDLVDALSVNPVEFLTSKDRVEILLEAVEAEVDPDEIAEILEDLEGDEVEAERLVKGVKGLKATDAIDRVASAVYSARTGVNRVVKEKRNTASQLRESIPEDVGDVEDVEKELEVAESHLEELRTEAEKEKDRMDDSRDERVQEVTEARDAKVAELQAEIDRVKEEAESELQDIRGSHEEAVSQLRSEYGPRLDEAKEEIATLRERLKSAESFQRTSAMAAEAQKDAETHAEISASMTEALGRLDALKGKVLSDIPIEGAEIEDGELLVDGVHFDRLNSAKKVEIALQVAELKAGELGLVLVDDLELLDTEHFEAMVEALKESDLQAIITRVSDDSLEVETIDDEDD